MNSIPELVNLANGSAAAGDTLAVKICRDAIAEIERLRKDQQWMHVLIGRFCILFPGKSLQQLPSGINRLQSIKTALQTVATTGILPDGDHVNLPTKMWLEELAAEAGGESDNGN